MHKNHLSVWVARLAVLLAAMGTIFLVLLLMIRLNPAASANGADELRKVFGDRPVAFLEMTLYQIQDISHQTGYALGLEKPVAPWQTLPSTLAQGSARVISVPETQKNSTQVQNLPSRITSYGNGESTAGKALSLLAPESWTPPQVNPLGAIAGEGVWQPYLQDSKGNVLAYRTFLQPDPKRPYALIGVVAFNLDKVRLHFQLGFEEPYDSNQTWRANGQIPAADLVPGKLLAAFNGGFKVRHGHFGAMQDGKIAVPPRVGMATLVFYKDGHITLGSWDPGIQNAANVLAYRQNGPLVIQNGELTPQVDNPQNWGYTLTGGTVTWRSGLGLSRDGRTLYYVAGPDLTIHTLAAAMQAAGVYNAMQLDINNYWVHFSAFSSADGMLASTSLFSEQANERSDRFLQPYARDFFYFTTP